MNHAIWNQPSLAEPKSNFPRITQKAITFLKREFSANPVRNHKKAEEYFLTLQRLASAPEKIAPPNAGISFLDSKYK